MIPSLLTGAAPGVARYFAGATTSSWTGKADSEISSGNFKEAEGTITLPEQSSATFKHFVHWLYTDNLSGFFHPNTVKPTIFELEEALSNESKEFRFARICDVPRGNMHRLAYELVMFRDLPFASLVALYVFADALQVQNLKDCITSALIDVYGFSSGLDSGRFGFNSYWTDSRPAQITGRIAAINMAFRALPRNCNLCKLLVQLYCDSGDGIECYEEPLDSEFLMAIADEYSNRWIEDLPTSDWTQPGRICQFHEHEGKSCALAKIGVAHQNWWIAPL